MAKNSLNFELEVTQFRKDVASYLKVLRINSVIVIYNIALRFLYRCLANTPVASIATAGYVGGRAAGGWFKAVRGLDGVPVITKPHDPVRVQQGVAEGYFKLLKAAGRTDVVVGNLVPYIVMLELGHSKQAAAGMMRVAMIATSRELKKATQSLILSKRRLRRSSGGTI